MLERIVSQAKVFACAVLVFGLAACSGGGGSGNGGFLGAQCNPGTDVQLASPLPNATGVSASTNQIVIVANGQNNYLHSSYQNWNVVLQDNFGNQLFGGALALTSDSNGPHPYGQDFYYAANVQNLVPGTTYSASIVQANTNCNLTQIGYFST